MHLIFDEFELDTAAVELSCVVLQTLRRPPTVETVFKTH